MNWLKHIVSDQEYRDLKTWGMFTGAFSIEIMSYKMLLALGNSVIDRSADSLQILNIMERQIKSGYLNRDGLMFKFMWGDMTKGFYLIHIVLPRLDDRQAASVKSSIQDTRWMALTYDVLFPDRFKMMSLYYNAEGI